MPQRTGWKNDIRLLKRDLFDLKKRQGVLYVRFHAQLVKFENDLAANDERISRLEGKIDAAESAAAEAKAKRGNNHAEIP